jgi:hypothetical protein
MLGNMTMKCIAIVLVFAGFIFNPAEARAPHMFGGFHQSAH